MAEEGGELQHLLFLAASSAEPFGAVGGGGEDEGAVIPEVDGVGEGGIPFLEEFLELVHIEDVGHCQIAAEPGATFATAVRLGAVIDFILYPHHRRRRFRHLPVAVHRHRRRGHED